MARADLVVEAFYFLDLPRLELIDETVVKSKYRKAAVQCHPDSAKVIALTSEEDKAKASLKWQLLQHAKDVALGYLEGQDNFTRRCQNRIREKFDPTKHENLTFETLKKHLDQGTIGGALTN